MTEINDITPPWPKHPDGRNMTIGEMTREQARAQMLAAGRRVMAEPGVRAAIASLAEPSGPHLRRRADAIVTRPQHFELLNDPDRQAGDWWEVSEEVHDYFLDLLPPIWMPEDGFLLSEGDRGSCHHGFFPVYQNGKRRFVCVLFDRSWRCGSWNATARDIASVLLGEDPAAS